MHCLDDPVYISAYPGVDPRVSLPSAALAPGHNSYLGVWRVLVSPPDHGTAAVPLTGVQDSLVISGTHHVLCYLTRPVSGEKTSLFHYDIVLL